jgi:uncharacterized surface protein with fasciclin (FAS1) repeats
MSRTRSLSAAVTAGVLALTLSACGSSDDDTAAAAPAPEATESSAAPVPSAAPSVAAAMGEPFGPGCAAVPADGAGSFTGMATAPVATAASANPLLSTLVTAVTEAGLVDTLNTAEGITVFAPSNDAFAKIPAADLEALLADKAALTSVLTYHVVGETVTPEQLGTAGPFASLEGREVAAAGSGEEFTVNETANVVCGGVETANATVYIIDSVLMPPAA